MIHLVCPNPALDRTVLMENFAEDVVNRPTEVHENAGGKSFNVAYILKQEKTAESSPFCIHTMLGGKMGEYIAELNQDQDIPLVTTQVRKNTRTCTIMIDTVKKKTYLLYEAGFDLDQELLNQFTENLLSAVQSGDTVVFSGSLMKGMPEDYIAQVAASLPEQVDLVVDTSGAALISALTAQPKVLKINDEELAEMTGSSTETAEEVAALLKEYQEIPFFIVTMGGKGVVARLQEDVFHLTFPKIDLKNPIASGDFFLGSLCFALANRGKVDREAVIRACAYATANCLQWTPRVEMADVERIIQEIELREL
ncbi:1-phosphofructokinase family hexose kinase [Streptococcus himalayensis]|uniref:Tagatose-6-phosphate kinase n=1 Tax=Streptococcus himalayensis TaxID=1888195 RepID=A0A917EG44_9STRE|nr:PfkB family carbohydrate kinase [Streptococcus himalayensis]GGE29649.1 tagatose-6-phosphate kinase [Streptococcus himalayensis]